MAGFEAGSLENMSSTWAGLMGDVSDLSGDQAPGAHTPNYGIEFIKITEKCSNLKGFENCLLLLDFRYGIRRAINANASGELRPSGTIHASHLEFLILDAGYSVVLQAHLSQGTCFDVKIKKFATVNEESEKGVVEVEEHEFGTCYLTGLCTKAGDQLYGTIRYTQHLSTIKVIGADGKIAGNMAGAIDYGSGEVGKVEKK